MIRNIWLYALASSLTYSFLYAPQKVAIVIVIDGCGMEYFQQARPFFKGGLKKLCDDGIIFSSCCFPYAGLSTGPGHATISSGALPCDHGIVDNSWIADDGAEVVCDADNPANTAVLSPTGKYSYGKSPRFITADTLSDTATLYSNANVIALSAKSRAAICMAGRLGKAYWFDSDAGRMTTSEYYHSELPPWLQRFNASVHPRLGSWKLMHSLKSPAYSHVYNSEVTSEAPSLAGKKVCAVSAGKEFKFFDLSPSSLDFLAECSLHALKHQLASKAKNIILWVSFSTLDKLGHLYGPESLEYVDSLYHLDRALDSFLKKATNLLKNTDAVIMLTADHGNIPMIETLQQRGFSLAGRINSKNIKQEWNKLINERFGIEDLIARFDETWISIPEQKLSLLNPELRQEVLTWIVHQARTTPGIKNAWTQQELLAMPSLSHDWITRYKNQLVRGRSGPVIIQLEPYVYVGKYDRRTGHNSPYFYSSNVPLIWYTPEKSNSKTITSPVWMTQAAPTLAQFLNVPRPSMALYSPLKEVYFANKEN